MTNLNEDLFASVDEYIHALFVVHDEALQAALDDSIAADLPTIHISPNQGKFLYLMALLSRARTILEIGALGGYSAIWMARALPADGRLITLEHNPKHAEVARANIARAGLSDRVEVREGSALDLLPQLVNEQAGPFDMVFVDADKMPYTEYLDWSIRLAHPGTLIIADNVVRGGQVLDAQATDESVVGVQRFNAALAVDERVEATIIQMVGLKGHDGLSICVVR